MRAWGIGFRLRLRSHERFTVLLIAAGIALVALSFGFPWFRLDFVGYTDLLESGSYSGGYDCYATYFAFIDKGDHSIPAHSPWHGGVDDFENLMDIELGLAFVAILTLLSFMWAVLIGSRRKSLILGSIAAGVALLAVVVFAFAAGDSISVYSFDPTNDEIPRGFFGSGTDDSGTDWTWGPSTGWAVMVLSTAMIVIAVANQALLVRGANSTDQAGVKGQ